MKHIITSLILLSSITLFSQEITMDYYLDLEKHQYDEDVPTPDEIIGYVPGEWHVGHDQLVYYFRALDEASDRVTIEPYGFSHEKRPLMVAIITSEKNHQRLDEIKTRHLQNADPSEDITLGDDDPAIVWLGHTIHGNEPSGSNSALLSAYHFAAAIDEPTKELLDNTVIIIDPCINPDGMNRFASWANSHRSQQEVPDNNTREHIESWPRGRTNHYWFDLNRDWLPLTQPESQGRIAKIQEWKPNILTDHHEMGTNSTFHFSPGEPLRVHPMIPQKNQDLTYAVAEYHAKFFDDRGVFYYTAENFDDYYIGRGPTYLDFNGGVAILFEQASSRGFEQNSENGVLQFEFTILNQFTMAQSTVQAGYELRKDFQAYQNEYYSSAIDEAANDPVKAYVFGDNDDQYATRQLAEMVDRHGIEIFKLSKDFNAGGNRFEKDKAYVVPLSQAQYRLVHGIFEKRTTFKDSLFYDISGWTFPLAFGLPNASLSSRQYNSDLKGDAFDANAMPEITVEQSAYAYVFEWSEYLAPRALNMLLEEGIITKVGTIPFSERGGQSFERGSLMVPVEGQTISGAELNQLMQQVANNTGIEIASLSSGYTSGTNLGSNNFERVYKPKIIVPIAGQVNGYDAGEVWHLFDKRYEVPVSLVDVNMLDRIDINDYNTMIMVDGNYNSISESATAKIGEWLTRGNSLIAFERALNWMKNVDWIDFEQVNLSADINNVPYELYRRKTGARRLGGSILEADVDPTHPLLFGYTSTKIPIFKANKVIYTTGKSTMAHPIRYSGNPMISGYGHPADLAALSGTPAVLLQRVGNGRIIAFNDNTNFRAYWYGTNKLLANAVFFGPLINGSTMR
ncbi:MAG: M14 family zinc carboxypeptidase [Bacteroidota bacterium]